MTSVQLYETASSIATLLGNVTLQFHGPGFGRTWQGTVSVLASPQGTEWTVSIGAQAFGVLNAPGPAGPYQLLTGQTITLTAAGLTAGVQYSAILSGGDYAKDEAPPYGGPTIVNAVVGTVTPASSALAFNVMAYGAVGNGVADDTVPIQAAITAALANSLGGIVFFPPGIYICNHALTPAQSSGYLIIQGSGRNNTILRATLAVDAVINLQMPGSVRDMTIDGGAVSTNGLNMSSTAAISDYHVSNVTCQNVSPTAGIWLLIVWDLNSAYGVDMVRLDNVTLLGPTNPAGDGMAVSFVNRCFVSNMKIDNVYRTPNFFAINDLHVNGISVTNSPGNSGLVIDSLTTNAEVVNMTTDGTAVTRIKATSAKIVNSSFGCAVQISDNSFNFPIDVVFEGCTIAGNVANTSDASGLNIFSAQASVTVLGGKLVGTVASYEAGVTLSINAAAPLYKLTLDSVELDLPLHGNILVGASGTITLGQVNIINCTGISPGHHVEDGVINSTTTFVSASALFTARDVGRSIFGTGIPASTTISSVINAASVIMSHAATATATAVIVGFGALPVTLHGGTFIVASATTRFSGNIGLNPVGSVVPGTAFAIGATTVAAMNTTGVDGTLYVTAAGTVTAVSVNGVVISPTLAVGDTYRLVTGATLTLTYSAPPTLVFVGD